MKNYKFTPLKIFFITVILINITLQCILYSYVKGINLHLLIGIFQVSSITLYSIIYLAKSREQSPKRHMITIAIFVIFLVAISIKYSPRITYDQAKNKVLENFSDDKKVQLIELEISTISSSEPMNIFISELYIFSVDTSSEILYYIVNPCDGSVILTEFTINPK